MKVRMALQGTRPLMMHNIRLANPLDPIVREIKTLTKKRTKTDDDHAQIARLEFEGGLYFDSDVGPFVPGVAVEKCLVEGARVTKQGKQIERGLRITDDVIPLIYKGPRDVVSLWDDEAHRSVMFPRVGTSRVMRTRPIFADWRIDVDAIIDPALLNLDGFRDIVTDAGTMIGLLEYRPRFGAFTGTVEEL